MTNLYWGLKKALEMIEEEADKANEEIIFCIDCNDGRSALNAYHQKRSLEVVRNRLHDEIIKSCMEQEDEQCQKK